MTKILVDKAVMEQALETFEEVAQWESEGDPAHPASQVIDALRAALEQSQVEQEPAIYLDANLEPVVYHTNTQPKREPLTDDERQGVYAKAIKATNDDPNLSWRDAIVSETERAHGIGGDA